VKHSIKCRCDVKCRSMTWTGFELCVFEKGAQDRYSFALKEELCRPRRLSVPSKERFMPSAIRGSTFLCLDDSGTEYVAATGMSFKDFQFMSSVAPLADLITIFSKSVDERDFSAAVLMAAISS
jgi:hypothetical protein